MRRAVIIGGVVLTALVVGAVVLWARRTPVPVPPSAPPPEEPAPAATRSIEEEVRDNILGQPIGEHTVAALGLPDTLVRRIGDRVIRESYQDRFHAVYHDAAASVARPAPPPAVGEHDASGEVRIVRPESRTDVPAPEGRPELRGFRAPILDGSDEAWFFEVPAQAVDVPGGDDIVAEHLATDGLVSTLDRLLEAFPALDSMEPPERTSRMRAVGLPTDLLAFFGIDARAPRLRDQIADARFAFAPTAAGFRVATESGEHEIDTVRLQLTRGTYWKGPGAGGSIDVARQLVEKLSDAAFIVSVEERFAESLNALAERWPVGKSMTIFAEDLIVAQWAQDNGKPGFVVSGDRPPEVMTLAPRYASRRSDGSVFVPGETFLLEGLSAAGLTVVQSPLLFQGGNLMPVLDPATGERVLLIGEAEIARNTALGLSEEQVIEAFTVEFGVDRCVVLPSVSFHIDYEVTLRAVDGRLVAFVNDTDAAMRMVLDLGLHALVRQRVLDESTARAASEALRSGDAQGYVERVAGHVYALAVERHQFPLSVAEGFAVDAIDSPVGNLQRYLVALDMAVAASLPEAEQTLNPNTRAYLGTFPRTAADRASLHETLRAQGWEVVAVPSLAAEERSLTAINGVHDRSRYLMPAYGGFYAALDDLAAAAFRARLGPDVEVIPILCGETQRRNGAVHCAVSVLPRP
ncbi:MAG: hypothetical protein GY715_11475 [Planctomycetes bacterium]|nr:hypothetical protein [Planctomycetota bacterium]